MSRTALAAVVLTTLACAGGGPPVSSEEPASAPSVTEEEGCHVGALVRDPDPAGLNVRESPNGTIVGQLPDGTQLTIREQDGSWFRIEDAWSDELDTEALPEGWVHGSRLTTGLKLEEEYGPGAWRKVADAPGGSYRTFAGSPEVTVVGCEGRWLEVELAGQDRGWLPQEGHCPSSVTTCP